MEKIGEIIKNNKYWLEGPSRRSELWKKPLRKSIRAIILALFLIAGGLFLAFNVFASDFFDESFENYTTGQLLNGQGEWFSTDNVYISETRAYSGIKSARFKAGQAIAEKVFADSLATGSYKIWFWAEAESSGGTDGFTFTLLNLPSTKQIAQFSIWTDRKAMYKTNNNWVYYGSDLVSQQWVPIEIEWKGPEKLVRYNYNNVGWTEWVINADNTDTAVNKIVLDYEPYHAWYYWWLDKITMKATCGPNSCGACEIWSTCQNAGCFWYYSEWLDEGFCVSTPTGACGEGYHYEMCQNCLTEETCEEISNCYWSLDEICKFGTGGCGEGLECQFCGSQAACEEKGCFWYEDFCWVDEKPSLFSWSDYYDEYGDYEVPSDFINDLAENTQGFFEKIGGFLITFEKSFDLQEAYQKGKDLGGAVPKARGYLASLNNFVGYLPIGDFFLFVLVFMLAIGVFKGMTKLIQLAKFW